MCLSLIGGVPRQRRKKRQLSLRGKAKKVGSRCCSSPLVPGRHCGKENVDKRQLTSKESGFAGRAALVSCWRSRCFAETSVPHTFPLSVPPVGRNAHTQSVSCACKNAHKLRLRHFWHGTSENTIQKHIIFRQRSPNQQENPNNLQKKSAFSSKKKPKTTHFLCFFLDF